MEVLSTLLRAIDSLFITITIALGSALVALHIDFPPLTSYVPQEGEVLEVELPITHTTVAISIPTSTVKKTPSTAQKPVSTPLSSPSTATQSASGTSPKPVAINYEAVNANTRASLVNILCIARSGSGIGSISGSGIIVDSRGVILTNAHIGQFFLLKDYPTPNSVECTIRTGSPAEPRYKAELLYLPPAWIDANASQLKAERPLGTGEHDYAFLRITASADLNTPLPASFPNVGLTTDDPEIGEEVLLAGYPAGFLNGTSIERDLYVTSAFTVVQKLFTFDEKGFIDVISIGGTVLSQGGASGGAVVRGSDSRVMSLISTATAGATTGDRDLRAVMLSHINRSLAAEGKGGIKALLSTDIAEAAADFATNVAPGEREKLITALNN